MMRRTLPLETVSVIVPEAWVTPFEAAIQAACSTTGLFIEDEARGMWRVEGVRAIGADEAALQEGLALAQAATGFFAELQRTPTEAEGWLARVYDGFPEQLIGTRLAVRGTHLDGKRISGRATLVVDAGLAFGTGEHGSTRGCLLALQRVMHRRPRRILDMGCGSGILAMAAAALVRRPVLAVDIDPWSVRVASQNARANGLHPRVRARLGNGWRGRAVRAAAPYDLVFANILARPLCLMARELKAGLAPGGTAILAGLCNGQMRMVLAAHRRLGLRLDFALVQGNWTTMVLRA